MDDDEIDIKKSFAGIAFVIFMCGVWGVALVFCIALPPLYFIDWILGSELVLSMQNILMTGTVSSRWFKLWLCGIPLTLIWLKSKNWKV